MKTGRAPGGARAYAVARRRRKKRLTAVTCMAALVVFCTVYALVMPAVTLEADTYCGAEEHTHTEDCYERILACELEEDHTHDESCYEDDLTLICQEEAHTHDASCYVDVLTCGLVEHTHATECYESTEEAEDVDAETADPADVVETEETGDTYCGTEEHTHAEDCYESVLICELEEGEKHTHDGNCYEDDLTCGLDEHTHTAECYVNPEETEVADTETEAASLPDGAMVPVSYTQQYTVQDEDNGLTVTVYATEDALPDGVFLSATLLSEDDDEYAEAEAALLAENPEILPGDGEETSLGFAALDIHFENARGREVEPDGDVYVVINAEGLLPEDADPDTVTVQSHAETRGTVTVETVADITDETDGVVDVTDEAAVQAAFEVDSFPIFTIQWSSFGSDGSRSGSSLTVYYGTLEDDQVAELDGVRNWFSIDVDDDIDIESFDAPSVSGYSYTGTAYIVTGSGRGQTTTQIYGLRYDDGDWQYNSSSGREGWQTVGDGIVYFIYRQSDSDDDANAEAASLPEGAQVPDGYTQQYTVRDEKNGFAVTVYAPEDVVPEGATLSATLLSEDDDAYAEAEEALAEDTDGVITLLAETPEALPEDGEDESEETSYGFVALDIHFENAEGNEIEPEGSVYVVIDAAGLLPADADPETVTVQHHAETDGTVSVETVADTAGETDGVVAVTDETAVQAAFEVDSFSTFTISWSSGSGGGSTTYFRVTVHYVDENGNEIQGTRTTNISASVSNNSSATYTFSDYAGTISGYTYSDAHYNSYNGDEVTSMTFSQTTSGEGRNQNTTRALTFYNGSSTVATLTYNNTKTADVYLVYTKDSTGGGSTGGSSTVTSATVNASKTAVLNEDDGNYDLTLSISGTRGSETSPAMVDVLFIVDRSSSMTNNNSQRLANAKAAMNTLVNSLENNSNIDALYSIVTFSGPTTTGDSNGKNDATVHMNWTSVSGSNVSSSISSITASGGTNYQAGLEVGTDQLASARSGAIKVVIFLSDGEPTWSYNYGSGSGALDRTQSSGGSGGPGGGGSTYQGWVETLNQAREISCDYFYAVGIGSSSSEYLKDLVNAVTATTKDYIEADSNGSNLTSLFNNIASSVTFFAAENVTITDTLSEYADIVLVNDSPQFTITVTRAAYTDSDGTQHAEKTWSNNGSGTTLTFQNASGGDVTLTASYDAVSKTITLDFPDDYELEEGYTYSVSTVIKPSDTANSTGETGYDGTGDENTGTHADQSGFYSNGTAEVTFTANEERGSAEFPKPVIQVQKPTTVDVTFTKVDASDTDTTLIGAQFRLYYTEDNVDYYYHYGTSTDGSSTVAWNPLNNEDEIEPTTLTSTNGSYTIYGLEDGTYYLEETKAPDGYQLPSSPITVTVYGGKVTSVLCGSTSLDISNDGLSFKVTNTTGQILPETGGAGTTYMTISGLLIMAAAVGGGYVLRRRHRREVR